MNAPNDELELLAGEYVLGTLDAETRREFAQRLRSDLAARHAVHRWEQRLAPLAMALAPVEPDAAVWDAIRRRIEPPARAPRWLAAWAALATAASVALAALLLTRGPTAPPPVTAERPAPTVYVALLAMRDADMHWTVSVLPERGRLRVRAGGTPPPQAAGRSPELWLLADDGPVPVGLLPVSGEAELALPAGAGLADGRQLAVSLEPPGGSPTGQPTGPVVAVAPVQRVL